MSADDDVEDEVYAAPKVKSIPLNPFDTSSTTLPPAPPPPPHTDMEMSAGDSEEDEVDAAPKVKSTPLNPFDTSTTILVCLFIKPSPPPSTRALLGINGKLGACDFAIRSQVCKSFLE